MSRTRMILGVLAAWPLSACGSAMVTTHEANPPVLVPSAPASDPPPSASAWEVHEWGLVDLVLTTGVTEVAAGPGRPGIVVLPGPVRPPMQTRKPVIYVHLAPEMTEFDFGVRVVLPRGRIVEHSPNAALTADGLIWSSVHATHGACADAVRRDQPARRTTACNTPDGYCEVNDLASYVTSDASCLEVGGAKSGFLFYRGASTDPELPLTVSSQPGGSAVVHSSGAWAGTPESIYRVVVASAPGPITREAYGRPTASVRVLRATVPAQNTSLDVGVPTMLADPAQLRAALERDLTALGLTREECRVFLDAWIDELFVAPHARDVLLYWLPMASIDAVSRLEFDPAPTRIRRAMLVRIDLGV